MKNNYFHFSKKERTGILILILANMVVLIWPHLKVKNKENIPLLLVSNLKIDSIFPNYEPMATRAPELRKSFSPGDTIPHERFYFDPNTLTTEGWLKLGVPQYTAASLNKFLTKGGRFRNPEDLYKIYNLPRSLAQSLLPWVKIAQDKNISDTFRKPKQSGLLFTKKFDPKGVQSLEINSADSSSWTKLQGIGPGFARRIINFREKLGGFVSIEQIKETYGLPDSTYQKILPVLVLKSSTLKFLDLNKASKEELKQHPYLRWKGANAIVNYRESHGWFKNKEELLQIPFFTDSVFLKIKPYLTL